MGEVRRRADPHRQDRPGALLRGRAARQGRLREDRDQRRRPRAAHASARCRRCRARTCACRIDLDLQQAMVTAFGDHGRFGGGDRPAHRRSAGDGQPAGATTPTCSSTASRTPTTSALMDNPSRPLFNRNVLGGGPPGSTVKPLIALAGLDSGLRTPGRRGVFDRRVPHPGPAPRLSRCARRRTAGPTCASRSPRRSTPTTTSSRYDMGIERFDEYMHRYGFGAPTGIDLAGETSGIVPSPEWKAQALARRRWYPGRDGQRRHRPGLLGRDDAAAGARHRGDRQWRRLRPPAPGRGAPRRLRRAVAPLPQPRAGAHHRQRRATCARCRKA